MALVMLLLFLLWFFKKFLYVFYFLAVLGFSCCSGFSLVVESGDYTLIVVHGLLLTVISRCRAQTLGHTGFSSCSPHDEGTGSVVKKHRLSSLRHVESSWVGNPTRVSCIGKQILYH